MATASDNPAFSAFEKTQHSSLEYAKQRSEAPFKERAEPPIKARTAVSAFETARGAREFTQRVSEAVHGRSLQSAKARAEAQEALDGNPFVVSATSGSAASVASGIGGAAADGGKQPTSSLLAERSPLEIPAGSAAALPGGGATARAAGVSAASPKAAFAFWRRKRPGKSLPAALAEEGVQELKMGTAHAAGRAPRAAFYKASDLGEQAAVDQAAGIRADAATDDYAKQGSDLVVGQVDPVTLKGEYDMLVNNVLPAGRARGRMARWASKAKVAEGKSVTLAWKAQRAGDLAQAVGPSTLRGRWLQRRQKRLSAKSRSQLAKMVRLTGAQAGSAAAGSAIGQRGLRARIMAFRRKKAGLAADVFGWKNVAKATGSVIGGVLVLFCAGALVMALVGAASTSSSNGDTSQLEGNCQIIANYLLGKGLNNMQTAAVLGNMYQESGYSTTSENSSSGAFGICQWTDTRKAALQALAAERGVPATDLQVQLDYFWSEFTAEAGGGWSRSRYEGFVAFNTDAQLEEAVEYFCRYFERPGEGEMFLDKRNGEARRVLELLNNPFAGSGGAGQDYAASSSQQQAIVNSCHRTPSPGAGYCAAWVSRVYQNAGFGYPGGNACDMYWNYCTSSDRSQLKVGMIVAVPSHNHDSAGMRWGHVAIYIGDNKVMENVGSIKTTDLDSWIAYYGTTYPVKWGFAANVQAN